MSESVFFETESLDVGYDEKTVISDIDIRLEKGRILTLIGPNGAGKSTILKTIAGRIPRVSGTIRVNGKNLSDYSRHETARFLAVMFTDSVKTELMTAREVIEAGRYPYTGALGVLTPQDHEAVDRAVRAAHVEELVDRDFMTLSDGQRQRVLLARAMAQEPELLILDEPTSYLDIRYQLELLDILRQMSRERKTTIIMSLHELFLAELISDRIVCVKDGRIDNQGTADQIFSGTYIDTLYDLPPGTYGNLRRK